MNEYLKRLQIFYAARLTLLGESDMHSKRIYEDDKIEIHLGQTVFADDTISIYLKDSSNTKVFEMALCPSPFSQQDSTQIYLTGRWENYLTDILLPREKEQIKKRFGKSAKNKIDDFANFINNVGSIDNNIKTGEIDDEDLFT